MSVDENIDIIDEKSPNLYPLILLCTRKFYSTVTKKLVTQRWIERNRDFDKRWYAPALPFLYARQVAKYDTWYRKTRNGKSPLELPYSIKNIYDSDEIEAEYDKWNTFVNPGNNWHPGGYNKKSTVDAQDIIDEQLEC